ncbi:AAA-ATPase ASD, mitochondrial [Linum grandiflorum]
MMESWTTAGSAIGSLMFAWAMFQQYFPYQLRGYLDRYTRKLTSFFYPYIQITFPEFTGDRLKQSQAFSTIQHYLTAHSSASAKRLKADFLRDSHHSVLLSMDDHEEVSDLFRGVKVWWASRKTSPKSQSFSFYPAADDRRYFTLTVHKRHRDIITTDYIAHVLDQGKEIASRDRLKKLYTNNPSQNWSGWKATKWSHVQFEHPATFDTLGMAVHAKERIKKDLLKFSQGKHYYNKIGKPWKRGYLLYGPPGTGKSTMIAAMANFLNYDIYDLELTTVKDNSELRKLLIETTGKSIIVIEDIDCSLDLTGQRKKAKKSDDDSEEKSEKEAEDPVSKAKKEEEKASKSDSKVTLSGLLNFIDGIWSACGGERIIVFTTNYVDKLDPALIRRGRMDMHIEMSYCCFEAFKLLVRNYLDVEEHEMFGRIEELLGEIKMTPADVAENLMPKSDEEDEDMCLRNLVEALEAAKEDEAKKEKEKEEAKVNKGKEEEKPADENNVQEEEDDSDTSKSATCTAAK